MAAISLPIIRLPTSRSTRSQNTVPSPFPSQRRLPIPEPTPLDHRILKLGGTTSTLDLLPHRIQQQKSEPVDLVSQIEKLLRDNGSLRQEISRLTKARDGLLELRQKSIEVFYTLRTALQRFSDKAVAADSELSGYWGLQLDDTEDDDIIMF
jgi:hypothetical protein